MLPGIKRRDQPLAPLEMLDRAIAGVEAQLKELVELRTLITTLQDELGTPAAIGLLRPGARIVFGLLLKHEQVSANAIVAALWGRKPYADSPSDPVQSARQVVSQIRTALAHLEITVETDHGSKFSQPYFWMTAESKKRAAVAFGVAVGPARKLLRDRQ
jgi:hypothetical protein